MYLYVVPKSIPIQHPLILSVDLFSPSPPRRRRILENFSESSDVILDGFLNHWPLGPNTAEDVKQILHATRRRHS